MTLAGQPVHRAQISPYEQCAEGSSNGRSFCCTWNPLLVWWQRARTL